MYLPFRSFQGCTKPVPDGGWLPGYSAFKFDLCALAEEPPFIVVCLILFGYPIHPPNLDGQILLESACLCFFLLPWSFMTGMMILHQVLNEGSKEIKILDQVSLELKQGEQLRTYAGHRRAYNWLHKILRSKAADFEISFWAHLWFCTHCCTLCCPKMQPTKEICWVRVITWHHLGSFKDVAFHVQELNGSALPSFEPLDDHNLPITRPGR